MVVEVVAVVLETVEMCEILKREMTVDKKWFILL